MKKLIVLFILLLLIPCVFAQKNSIKLLAVNEGTKEGAVADLSLEIKDGSERVFIETMPLSQIDTQISIRIARIMACKISERYCLDKDFFYSLRTASPVIAGPSAGAAMTLLTIASLENKKINPDTVITGTINSGGVIGPVGGIKEKLIAASKNKLKKVLIPRGETNATDIIEYGKNLGVEVIEVSDIEEAYEIFTGEKKQSQELIPDEKYTEIMMMLNKEMCDRTKSILGDLQKRIIPEKYNNSFEMGLNLSKEAEKLFLENKYYSSASRCFGANVYLKEILLGTMNLTEKQTEDSINFVRNELKKIEIELNATKLTNLGDLETEMIIRERISDAKININDANTTNSTKELSYAIERTMSAFTWKRFFGFSQKLIDETELKESCILKMQEVSELYNYISIYIPSLTKDIKDELDSAKEYMNTEDYILCLFKASKSEADVNTALSALYIEETNVKSLLQNKILAAKKAILKQISKGNFPILGYSYYEYAEALNETQITNALLYAEYGIELSNLDIYFPAEKPLGLRLNENALLTLIMGFIIGISFYFMKKHYTRKKIVLKRKN